MEIKNEKKVLVLSFLGVVTLIAVVVGATYAYFQAQGGGTGNIMLMPILQQLITYHFIVIFMASFLSV